MSGESSNFRNHRRGLHNHPDHQRRNYWTNLSMCLCLSQKEASISAELGIEATYPDIKPHTSFAADAQLVCNINVALVVDIALFLLHRSHRFITGLPGAATKRTRNFASFGVGPHLEAFLVDVLPTFGTAPYYRPRTVGIKFVEADGAVTLDLQVLLKEPTKSNELRLV